MALRLMLLIWMGVVSCGHAAEPPLCSNQLARIVLMREGNVFNCYLDNTQEVTVTATFEMELLNMKGNVAFPYTRSYPPKKNTKAFTIWRVDRSAPWRYSFTNHVSIGNLEAKHDESFIYSLPYASGKRFRVLQGYDGAFSHSGDDQYAIDWNLPEGTPVHAARGGRVASVKADSTLGGPERKFEACANYVMVEHSDGTIGHYVHLQSREVKVKPGDVVKAGDLLALSGSTGFSSGPHLHFAVFKARDGRNRETIPTRFWTANEGAVLLKDGRRYASP